MRFSGLSGGCRGTTVHNARLPTLRSAGRVTRQPDAEGELFAEDFYGNVRTDVRSEPCTRVQVAPNDLIDEDDSIRTIRAFFFLIFLFFFFALSIKMN